ncbi:hypothetical protein ACT691_01910 [Vibrio metschnikovii]
MINGLSTVTDGWRFWWLYKREGWHRLEALLGAISAAMAAILVISESGSEPSSKVVYAHSVRLIILILLAGSFYTVPRIAVSHPLMGSEQWLMLGRHCWPKHALGNPR